MKLYDTGIHHLSDPFPHLEDQAWQKSNKAMSVKAL